MSQHSLGQSYAGRYLNASAYLLGGGSEIILRKELARSRGITGCYFFIHKPSGPVYDSSFGIARLSRQ
jgi:hypothetical protein